MKKRVLLIAIVLLGVRFGYSQVNTVCQAQSMFIYNFSRLIQWPAGSQSGDFIIGIIGDDELYNSLITYVSNKKVGSQSISIKKFDSPDNVTRCHIVFVGNRKVSSFDDIIGKLRGSNSLITYVSNKKVGSQPIAIKKFDSPENVTRCHIVFVGNRKVSSFDDLIGKLRGSNSLIITEKKGMINMGSAIDFFMEQDKLKFMINSTNAQKYNLTVSKSLEDMAYRN